MIAPPTAQRPGFVPIRADAFDLLCAPGGRREGHEVSALLIATLLADEMDWRTNTLARFCSVAWLTTHRIPWHRGRHSLDLLDERSIARAALRLFRPGTATLTSRDQPTSVLHDKAARPAERYVMIPHGALASIAEEHRLPWMAAGLLLLLLLLCDYQTASLPANWTKSLLCKRFGLGWRRLTDALEDLAAAGLITYTVRRGGAMTLSLLARPALVVPATPAPPRRPKRRSLRRDATKGSGPSAGVAAQLLAHYHLTLVPSDALLKAISDALVLGIEAPALLERLVAWGSLATAADPMAVFVSRARAVKRELVAVQEEQSRRRQMETDAARYQAEEMATAERSKLAAEAESRWIAEALVDFPTGDDLGLSPLVASRPVYVADVLHTGVSALIKHLPDLDPEELIQRWAKQPCPPEDLDTSGIGLRLESAHGPPGTVPQVRAGPSLLDRLRDNPS